MSTMQTPNDVETTLSGLRAELGARNNAELARVLGVDQSTVSTWKKRGRVPDHVLRKIEPVSSSVEAMERGELHDGVTAIASVRWALAVSTVLRNQTPEENFRDYKKATRFFIVIYRANLDVIEAVKNLEVDINTACAIILQNDLKDLDACAQKTLTDLEEDLRDNPHLFR